MVAAPSSSVSWRPRRCRMRSVKMWPRSRSPASCTSSMATKAASVSRGIASTVQTEYFAPAGDDLLLAGDQRHLVRADLLADAGIDLARQQPQRQADDAALMRHHALDGEMRLAGIGRTEHRRHVASGEHEGVGVFGLKVHREGRQPFWLVGSGNRDRRLGPQALLDERLRGRDTYRNYRRGPKRNVAALMVGTSLERIGDESLTRCDSGFVHRNM